LSRDLSRDRVIGNGSGSAYVFTRTGSVWTEQAKLLASDGAGGDAFGISVALDGDTPIVGARDDDDNGEDSGSAYVFRLIPDDGAMVAFQQSADSARC